MVDETDEQKQLNNILSQKLDELDSKPKDKQILDDCKTIQDEKLSQENVNGSTKKSLWKFQYPYEWLVSQFYEFFADFCEDQGIDENVTNSNENKQLSVKKLKETIKRFRTDAKPIYDHIRYFHFLITWKNPAVSFITLCLYTYLVWHGWLIPFLCLLGILKLFINLLQDRGWNINFRLFPDNSDADDKEETKDLGVTDKVQLVLNIATKVQVSVSNISDNLEKLKNLLTWQSNSYTKRLVIILFLFFLATSIFSGSTVFRFAGLYLGVKFFILDAIYNKFPRVRRKYDSTYNMWMNLPTDSQLENRLKAAAINRNVLSLNEGELNETDLDASHAAFCQIFSLPSTEKPLPGWINGRRCTKISRDKPITSAFKNGKLYLTNSFICFERNKAHSSKNLLIPLINVQNVVKAKYNSWFPGNGMAIEIQTETEEQPLLFGAIINRDECYENILNHALIRQLPWAVELQNSQSMTNSNQNSPVLRKRKTDQQEIED